jgi:uncharacterized protein YacL
LFRVALKNDMTLTKIDVSKATILLSVNAIIVSLALSNLLPNLDKPSIEYLISTTFIFIILSIIFSVLGIGPGTKGGKFTKQDKVNLLFFDNFHKNTHYEVD